MGKKTDTGTAEVSTEVGKAVEQKIDDTLISEHEQQIKDLSAKKDKTDEEKAHLNELKRVKKIRDNPKEVERRIDQLTALLNIRTLLSETIQEVRFASQYRGNKADELVKQIKDCADKL